MKKTYKRKALRFDACPYCNRAFSARGGKTIDHIVPKGRGGSNSKNNLITVCSQCNHDKGDMLITEFYGFLRAAKDERADIIFAALSQAAKADPGVWEIMAIDGAAGVLRHTVSLLRAKGLPSWLPTAAAANWAALNNARAVHESSTPHDKSPDVG